jgi:hypothetical protein
MPSLIEMAVGIGSIESARIDYKESSLVSQLTGKVVLNFLRFFYACGGSGCRNSTVKLRFNSIIVNNIRIDSIARALSE